MSGFDDLLKQSSRALEENPFEDPFAQPRAISPDPWSSFGNHSAPASDAFDYGNTPAFEPSAPTSPTTDRLTFAPAPATESDPLDSANLASSDEEPEPETPAKEVTSPNFSGFREVERVVPAPEPLPVVEAPVREPEPVKAPAPRSPSPIRPISPPRREPSPPTPPTASTPPPPSISGSVSGALSPPSPATPSSARFPQRQAQASVPSFPSSESQRVVASPLDQPPVTSFASLALGGETFGGGWDGEQSAFVNHSSLASSAQPEQEDDDDDDKPLRPRPTESTPTPKKDTGIQPMFVITVEDPQKVGDAIRGYTMYTVHTRTTSPLYSKSAFSVLRRYSDFLWLYEALSINNPGVVVPPTPEKNPFGRFDEQFLKQRRSALELCITKIANHPVLSKDNDLKLFLESDTFSLDIKHRKAEMTQERGGLLASIGQSFVGPRFVETDEWFDRQRIYLDTLESQLRGLVKAIDVVAKNRTELAVAMGEFAQLINDLATSDVGKGLAHTLASLADVERQVQEAEAAQAQDDLNTIMATADEYARLINSVRMAFSSRVRTYHNWQNADAEARRVRQTHDRNRAQGRIATDRLGLSLSQVADADRRALDAKQEFDQVSRLVKTEVARFEQERIEDFKASLERFLDGMITRQKEIIVAREAFQQIMLRKVPPTGQAGAGSLTSVM
ncbi:Vps5-domain-containing protein [Auriscalpium vulgare]|uniref:Vps5-domain-containing protein n=1 Tax=Auriscalpium vulgare TaxID=40419 RepID=A0ACB8RV66_9AGAM|nr:Vps5-domain-containing protein [Auriscalpium vulgare]